MRGEHSIRMWCEVLEVSRSGYYRSITAPLTKRKGEDAILAARIAAHHRQSRGNYGAPRIVEDLREEGLSTSRRRCARIMKSMGLRGKKKHRRKPRTTDSRHDKPVAPNRLAEVQIPNTPNRVWVTDITYLETVEGWVYLSVILDLFSRRVVGWACSATMTSALVIAALEDALKRRGPKPGLLHHSDRGSQYVSSEYVLALDAAGIVRSMSRAGNCYDNAAMESFWSNFKTETEMDIKPPATRAAARLAIFDHIETFYNPKRRHSSLGYLSPAAFELEYLKTNRNAA
jgi:putative transposase